MYWTIKDSGCIDRHNCELLGDKYILVVWET